LGEAEEARDVVRDVTEIFGEFNPSDFIWLFKKLDLQGFGKRIEDLFMRFDTLVEKIICKREEMRKNKKMVKNKVEEGAKLRDFLDVLLDCAEDENSEVKIERVHIKALIMVIKFIYILFFYLKINANECSRALFKTLNSKFFIEIRKVNALKIVCLIF
jgi:hypothetical protein